MTLSLSTVVLKLHFLGAGEAVTGKAKKLREMTAEVQSLMCDRHCKGYI